MRKAILFLLILFSAVKSFAQGSAFAVQPLTGERVQVTGGTIFLGTGNVTIPNTNLSMTDGSTNFLYISNSGVLSQSTSAFGAGMPIATVITLNGNIVSITDNRPAASTGPWGVSMVIVPFSATPTFTYVTGSAETSFSIQLTGNVTSSTIAGNFTAGADAQFLICQDGTGNRTLAFPSGFLNIPTLASTANSCTAGTWVFCGTAGSGSACPANSWQNTDQGPVGALTTTTAVTQGHIYVAQNCNAIPINVLCFQVADDWHVVTDATWANASSTVTTGGTDPPFLSTGNVYPATCSSPSATCDIGKSFVWFNQCNGTNPPQCVSASTAPAQGTITAITSAHVATVSATSTSASSAGSGIRNFGWGTIDTVPLQAAADALLTATTPTDLMLPCGSMGLDGVWLNAVRVTRGLYQIGAQGCEGGGTKIILLPNFTCGTGVACLINLTSVPGQNNNPFWSDTVSNIHFNGLGADLPGSNFTGTAHTFIRGLSGTIFRNVTGEGWLYNRASTNTDYGFECIGCKADGPVAFVFGNKPCHFQGGIVGGWQSTIDFAYCGGSLFTSVTIDGTNPQLTTRNSEFNSPLTSDGTTNAAAVNIPAGATVTWNSYGDQFGGTVFLSGAKTIWNGDLLSPNSGGGSTTVTENNAAARFTFNDLNYTTAAFTWLTMSAGTAIDGCGNIGIYNSGNQPSISGGTYINCPSQMISSTATNTASNPTANTDTQLTQLSLTGGYLNAPTQTVTIHGSGIYSTTAASVPALTFKVQLCTVSGCGSGTVVNLANIVTTALNTTALTNTTWNLEITCAVNATGATGTLNCHGSPGLTLNTTAAATNAFSTWSDTNTATLASIDLSAALFVRFTVAQSTTGASNSYTQQIASIR